MRSRPMPIFTLAWRIFFAIATIVSSLSSKRREVEPK